MGCGRRGVFNGGGCGGGLGLGCLVYIIGIFSVAILIVSLV